MTYNKRLNAVRILAVLALFVVGWRATGTVHANGVAFVKEDVMVAIGLGSVNHFSPTGTLKDTLNDGTEATYTTGECFDAAGNLYVTNFGSGSISKFDTTGKLINATWASGLATPESCVFNKAGDAYASQIGGGIVKLSPTGTVIATYPVGRTDWLALAGDQCTMYYTVESPTIFTYNVCTKTALPNFATLPSSNCYAMGIRPNGELLVACGGAAYRLSSAGAILQTYNGTALGDGGWFALSLDPDGTTFWTADIGNGDVVHLNIATGARIVHFGGQPRTLVAGLAVVGQIDVGGGGGGGNPFDIPTSTRPAHAFANTNVNACPTNTRFSFKFSAQVGLVGPPTASLYFHDNMTGKTLTTTTGALVARAFTREGKNPANAGNTASIYFSAHASDETATVRIDLSDVGATECKDTVRVRTSDGFDSGTFFVPNVMIPNN